MMGFVFSLLGKTIRGIESRYLSTSITKMSQSSDADGSPNCLHSKGFRKSGKPKRINRAIGNSKQ